MLGTLMTVLFLVVKVARQIGAGIHREEPAQYLAQQPLPWQVQCASRKTSRADEKEGTSKQGGATTSRTGPRRGPLNSLTNEENTLNQSASEKAAITIQTQYRKYQQRKNPEQKP